MKMEDNNKGSRSTWSIGDADTDWSDDSSGTNKRSSPPASFKCESPGGSESSHHGRKKHSSHRGMLGTCDSASRWKSSPYGNSKKHSAHCSPLSPEDFNSHKKVKKMEVDDCAFSGPTKREARSEGKSYAEALADPVRSGSRDLTRKTERKKRGSGIQTCMDSPPSECQEDPSESHITFEENLSSDSFLYSSAFDYTPKKTFDAEEKVSSPVLDRDGTELDFNVEVFSGDETDTKKLDTCHLFTEADSKYYGSPYQSEARPFSPSFGNSVSNTGGLSLSEFRMKPIQSTPENNCNGARNPFVSPQFDDMTVNFGTPEMSLGCVSDESLGNQSHLSELSYSRDSQRFYKKSEVEENAEDSREFSYLDKITSISVSSIAAGSYWKSIYCDEKTSSDDDDGESSIAEEAPNSHTNTEYNEIVGPKPENTKIADLQKQPSKGKSPSEIRKEAYQAQVKYINSVIKPSRSDSEGRKGDARELNQTFPGTRLRSYFKTKHGTPLSGRDHNFRSFKRNLSFEKEAPVSSSWHEEGDKERWVEEKEEEDVSPKRSAGKLEWRPILSSRQSEEGVVIRPATMPPQSEALITKEFTPGFIDTHCHLDFLFTRSYHSGTFETYRLKCKDQEAFPKSFEGCVAVFCEPWTFRKISWWEDIICEPKIWAAFGCHPHYVSKFTDQEESYLKHALQNKNVVALGEIGLDYSDRNNEDPDLQQEVFRKQLKIALDFKKPIVIHCRDAHRDCITILKQEVPSDHLIHRHCFTDTWEDAEEWMSAFSNVYLGFTGLVTMTNRRARMIRNVLKRIPLERILLETDTPYFRPFTTGLSHPGMAIHVAAEIASVKGMDIQKVLKCVRENTTKMYGI